MCLKTLRGKQIRLFCFLSGPTDLDSQFQRFNVCFVFLISADKEIYARMSAQAMPHFLVSDISACQSVRISGILYPMKRQPINVNLS